jgi:hypothetical protein
LATRIRVRKVEVAEVLAASFPGYAGRTFHVEVCESVYVDRMWGGGSRDQIVALTRGESGWERHAPAVPAMQAPCGTLPLDPRAVYAVHTIFCGKDMGVTFHVHPASPFLPRMLPEGAR